MRISEIRHTPVLTGLVAVFLSVFFWQSGLFLGFENFLQDLLLVPIGSSPGIVIVAIDDESIGKIGQWPWPRAEYAKLLGALSGDPPRVVGIDVLFAEPSRAGRRDDDKFADALKGIDFPVVLASRRAEGVVPLPQFLSGQKVAVGEVLLLVDTDGIVRRTNIENSFAQAIDLAAQSSAGDLVAGNARIAWAGPPGAFRRVPFARVLEEKEQASSLGGKIILVGSTATDLHDEQHTAISPGQAMPGVEIQANILNMILGNKFFQPASTGLGAALILLAALLPVLCFILWGQMWRPIVFCLGAFVLLLFVLILAWGGGLGLPVFYTLLAWFFSTVGQVLLRYFSSERSRRELKTLFGKYVSKEVLEELLKNPAQVKLGGEEREATILFSDIRGFTTVSETMQPTKLIRFLNRYFTVMTDVILGERGVVDKYIGDAIMAFWGVPVANADHRQSALRAATRMAEALVRFNDESRRLGEPQIDMGVGINSGPVVAGNMGSEQRFDYSVLGDAVNLASRLEGLTKYYGVQILASSETVDRDNVKNFFVREIDQVLVKGKIKPVKIFEIVSPYRQNDVEKIIKWWETAREYYYKGDWDKCLKMLADIENVLPDDGPTRVLRERCLRFKVMQPSDWTGIYEHKTK